MTADEVNEYINQIAFSGATDFIEKYKDKSNADQIIGHFGLGFYSCFMVSENVEIDSLSYKEGAKAIHWECKGDTDFKMKNSTKKTRGTTITLTVSDDGKVLTLKEENAPYYDTLLLSQQIDIDTNGMLLYKKEFARDANSINTGTLIQNASYIYS